MERDTLFSPCNQVAFVALPGDVTLMQASFTDHAFERHSHECFTIGVTLQGTQSFRCKGRHHDSQAGQLILFNPDDDHDGNRGRSDGFSYTTWSIPRAFALSCLIDADAGAAASPYVAAAHVIDPVLGARLMHLNHALLSTSGETLRAETLMRDFLTILFVRHGERRDMAPVPRVDQAPLARIKAYIDEHFARDLTVTELAGVAGLSRAHLTRAFSAAFHAPPHVYLNTVRVRRAQDMIRAGMTLSDVALASGFADQSHFTRRFKGSVGVAPAQWRAACTSWTANADPVRALATRPA